MPLSPQHSNHRLWILLGSPFLRSTFPSEEKTEKWWGCSPLSWFFVWLYSSLFSNKSINNGSINNDSMLVMRFHFFSTAGLTVIRDLVCGFKSSSLWFCSLFSGLKPWFAFWGPSTRCLCIYELLYWTAVFDSDHNSPYSTTMLDEFHAPIRTPLC